MSFHRIIILFLASALTYGSAVLGHAWSLTGLEDFNVLGIFSFILIPFASGAVAFVAAIGLLFSRLRQISMNVLFVSLGLIPMAIPSVLLAEKLRMAGFHRMAEQAQPIVDGVVRYEREQGSPPDSLKKLVPSYLPIIPARFSRLKILGSEQASLHHCKGNNWLLLLPVSAGVLNFDEFFYLPSQNYEQCKIVVERIGTWAYYHE